MEQKSEENWVVGNYCLAHGQLNAAANRLYYAVFQAVLGYAIAKKDYKYEGQGAHAAMSRMMRRYRDQFNELMDLRITADYEKEPPDETELRDLLEVANRIRLYHLNEAKR